MRETDKTIEAMKQALEALEYFDGEYDVKDEITALRAAIAEASMQRLTDVQQEMEFVHVGYRFQHPCGGWDYGDCLPAGFDTAKWASQKVFVKVTP